MEDEPKIEQSRGIAGVGGWKTPPSPPVTQPSSPPAPPTDLPPAPPAAPSPGEGGS